MLKVDAWNNNGQPCTILCLGAHSDDIEIGCGGTIRKIMRQSARPEVHWVVFSANDVRAAEAERAAHRFLTGAAGKTVEVKRFRESYFPFVACEIKEYFEELKARVKPDIVFTHCQHDYHQDHRTVFELTWNTFRDHLILEFEIPKYDGDLKSPNVYVHLDEDLCRQKVQDVMECFPSQRSKQWFTEETLVAVLRLRGIESNSATRYAEGFYCRKILL